MRLWWLPPRMTCSACTRDTLSRNAKGREFTTEERIIGANSQRTARMERALHAWALRREGLTIYEIARCLGVTRQTVHRYLRQHDDIMEEAQGVRDQMADVGTVTPVGSTLMLLWSRRHMGRGTRDTRACHYQSGRPAALRLGGRAEAASSSPPC